MYFHLASFFDFFSSDIFFSLGDTTAGERQEMHGVESEEQQTANNFGLGLNLSLASTSFPKNKPKLLQEFKYWGTCFDGVFL